MPFHIRDPEADTLVRQLASLKGVSLTEAVKIAAANELERLGDAKRQKMERIAEIQRKIAEYPPTGLVADKKFFDDLSGDI